MKWRSRGLVRFFVLLLAGASCLGAQSKSPDDLAVGKVLVAPRDSADPLFAKSVILLVRYDKSGALGLMINRRTTVPISRALSELDGAKGHSDPVFVGGPVEMDTVFALIRGPAKPDGTAKVGGTVYFVASKTALLKALGGASNPSQLRIYLGYCGWGPQQLESEVGDGRWYIFDGGEALAFDADPSTLWPRLITRTEERFAQLGFAVRALPVQFSSPPPRAPSF